MKFNEDTRVKIPAILHCMRLGYEYISLKSQSYDKIESTNIFSTVFISSIQKINPGLSDSEARQALDEISLVLENEDLGRAFYKKLINRSGVRLIDYENFDQNTFQVVTELTYKNGEDEFRPDITLLVNCMPLVFIEVKKPDEPLSKAQLSELHFLKCKLSLKARCFRLKERDNNIIKNLQEMEARGSFD